MKRNWIAALLGVMGLGLIGYASVSGRNQSGFAPELLASEAGTTPGVLEGEPPPLFESHGEIPLSGATLAGAPQEAAPAAPSNPMFQRLDPDHWVVQAVQQTFPDGLGDPITGELPRGLTRYELAVTLARVFERLPERPTDTGLELSQLAMLEKLGEEFRKELGVLGVDVDQVKTKVDALTTRVAKVEGKVDGHARRVARLEGQVLALTAKLNVAAKQRTQLAKRVDAADAERAELAEKGKSMGEVVSRLVVKSAVAGAQAKAGDTAKVTELAERVASLERRSNEVASHEDIGAGRVGERLKRLERLVLKVYRERGQGGNVDEAQVQRLRKGMAELGRRLATLKQSARASGGAAKVDPDALQEVKGLMKQFFVSFDQRLERVERRRM